MNYTVKYLNVDSSKLNHKIMPKVQIEIPLQFIHKAFILADMDLPSDEVILSTLGSEPVDLNVSLLGSDAESLGLAAALILIAQKFDNAS